MEPASIAPRLATNASAAYMRVVFALTSKTCPGGGGLRDKTKSEAPGKSETKTGRNQQQQQGQEQEQQQQQQRLRRVVLLFVC